MELDSFYRAGIYGRPCILTKAVKTIEHPNVHQNYKKVTVIFSKKSGSAQNNRFLHIIEAFEGLNSLKKESIFA